MSVKDALKKLVRGQLYVKSDAREDCDIRNPIIITDSRMNKYIDDNIEEIVYKMLDAGDVASRYTGACAFVGMSECAYFFNDAVEVGYYDTIEIKKCCDKCSVIPLMSGFNAELWAAVFVPGCGKEYARWNITHCPFCGKKIEYVGVKHRVYADEKILRKYGNIHQYKEGKV